MPNARADVVSSFSIIKGALIPETYAAFRQWELSLTTAENLKRLKHENPIGARSTRWLRDVVFVLQRRFDPGGRDRPLVALAQSDCSIDVWKPLLLWHMTRDEFLLRDFLVNWLYEQHQAAVRQLYADGVIPYLRSLSSKNIRVASQWTEPTTKRVAAGLLKISADFGLVKGRNVREFTAYHLPEESFLYLLHAMLEQECERPSICSGGAIPASSQSVGSRSMLLTRASQRLGDSLPPGGQGARQRAVRPARYGDRNASLHRRPAVSRHDARGRGNRQRRDRLRRSALRLRQQGLRGVVRHDRLDPAIRAGIARRGESSSPESLRVQTSELTIESVAAAARRGAPIAAAALERATTAIGLGVANAVQILNPSLVVLCGWLASAAGESLVKAVDTIVRQRCVATATRRLEVRVSPPKKDISAVGCALLAAEAEAERLVRLCLLGGQAADGEMARRAGG